MVAQTPRPSLVVFDNDGVLVDSEPLSNTVMAALLTELGVATTVDTSMARFMGRSMATVRHLVEIEDEVTLPADFEATYSRRLHDVLVASLAPVTGMDDVVRAVAGAGMDYCVASSGGHAKIALTHELTGFAELFEGRRFSADDVARGKPEPDLFLHAAASRGAVPADCLVIEDSAAGVTAAVRAGMACVGFAARSNPADLADASLGVVESASDLRDVLGV